jgi:hypothetical protein
MIEPSFPSYDNSLNHTFPHYANTITFQNDATFQNMFANAQQQQSMYPLGSQDTAQLYSQPHITNDVSNQFSMFGSLPAEVDSLMSFGWDPTSAQSDIKHHDKFIVPAASESLVSVFE